MMLAVFLVGIVVGWWLCLLFVVFVAPRLPE